MILSIDLGTSKICVAVVDPATAKPVAILSRPNDSDVANLAEDLHEQDPLRTRRICFDLIKEILDDEQIQGCDIDAIGISGQMHGVMLVDGELNPVTNLITWRDRRTARDGEPGFIGESIALLDDEAEDRTGCRLAVGYGAATLRWLARNNMIPPNSTALTIAGYIAASLCGQVAIDETHAASWGILDIQRNQWDDRCVSNLGLSKSVLPGIVAAGSRMGRVSEVVKDELRTNGEAVVCSPVGDCQASVIGCAGFSSDTIVVNIGTGAQISIPSVSSAHTEELDAWPMPFGGYLQLGAALCGGWAYAYLKQFYQSVAKEICGITLSDEAVYQRMNALAASAELDAQGLSVDTRFSGTRKDKQPKGAIAGINTFNFSPDNLTLAFLEGIVRDLHSMLLTTNADAATRVVASGNAVRKNPVLGSVIRRIFDRECFISQLPEEAARGAAYAAAVGVGVVDAAGITAKITEFVEPIG
ncbi:MAG: sedoheptulokinase [Armatimonadota bacterium]|jgi:sedoheptulokinase